MFFADQTYGVWPADKREGAGLAEKCDGRGVADNRGGGKICRKSELGAGLADPGGATVVN